VIDTYRNHVDSQQPIAQRACQGLLSVGELLQVPTGLGAVSRHAKCLSDEVVNRIHTFRQGSGEGFRCNTQSMYFIKYSALAFPPLHDVACLLLDHRTGDPPDTYHGRAPLPIAKVLSFDIQGATRINVSLLLGLAPMKDSLASDSLMIGHRHIRRGPVVRDTSTPPFSKNRVSKAVAFLTRASLHFYLGQFVAHIEQSKTWQSIYFVVT
jgi:hypothetical protein